MILSGSSLKKHFIRSLIILSHGILKHLNVIPQESAMVGGNNPNMPSHRTI